VLRRVLPHQVHHLFDPAVVRQLATQVASSDSTDPLTTHDIGFGIFMVGLLLAFIGGGNYVTRRIATARLRSKPEGASSFWTRPGVVVLPDWISFSVLGIGALTMAIGGVVLLVAIL
jgi:hypothetical protein